MDEIERAFRAGFIACWRLSTESYNSEIIPCDDNGVPREKAHRELLDAEMTREYYDRFSAMPVDAERAVKD